MGAKNAHLDIAETAESCLNLRRVQVIVPETRFLVVGHRHLCIRESDASTRFQLRNLHSSIENCLTHWNGAFYSNARHRYLTCSSAVILMFTCGLAGLSVSFSGEPNWMTKESESGNTYTR